MTKLSADAQTEYRLDETCGCAVDYRLANDQPLEWIGQGLRDVGIEPGSLLLTDDDRDDARALAAGCDPRTGEQLVDRKQVLDPRGKLSARTFVDAMRAAAEAAGTTPAGLLDHGTAPKTRLRRYAQLERGLVREGDAHKVPVRELGVLARAAGLDLDAVYGADRVATALQWAGAKVTIGNMGFDVTLECPKTLSVVAGTAPAALGKALRDTYMEAARESVAYLEDTCGYAMAGHHGDGRRAERRDTSGLLGWAMLHQAARPVPDAPAADAPVEAVDGDRADEDGVVDEDREPRHSPGDPHLHVHLTLVNMAHADDGKWRTIAAGGRDLHRHARVADAYNEARMRAMTARRFGMRWERRVPGGAWEVVGVPEEMRVGFSRRSTAIAASIATKGLGPGAGKSVGSATRRAKLAVTEDETRAVWRERGTALAGRDVDLVVAEAAPGWDGPNPTGPGTPPGGPPRLPSPTDVAARIWDPETGLTSHRKIVTRVDVLAAVLEECGEGVEDIAQAQVLTDQVLELTEWVVPLPGGGQRHMSDAARYTTVDIVEAEKTVTAHAIAGMRGRRFAAVPVDVAAAAVQICETTQQWRFSPEQLAVLDRFLTAGNAIESLVGVAGAGKTSLMTAARTGWEARDLVVAGASTASVAAENLFRESAIPARSIASWLASLDRGRGLTGVDVLVVDEGAMVDDRALARLVVEADRTGTKIVSIGDPEQLRAIGVGGLFAEVHRVTNGLTLGENRRQVDAAERDALQTWRDGDRRGALRALATAGHVHATDSPAQAHEQMLTAWADARAGIEDPHERIERVLLLAGRNIDVDRLNAGARVHARATGELVGADVEYGPGIALATGDVVRVRANDYRSRRSEGPDVLNGYRAVVTEQDPERGARIAWRTTGPDGPVTAHAWMSREAIAAGELTHGYAMTIAAAQGLTSDVACVYAAGADAYTIYPGITRAREQTHTWLPLDALEDDTTRIRLGPAADRAERLERAVNAYADLVERDRPDTVVSHELQEPVEPVPTPAEPAPDRLRQARETLERVKATLGGDQVLEEMRARQHGTIPTGRLVPDAEAAEARAARTEQAAADRVLAADVELVQAREGEGPRVRKLLAEREKFVPAAEQQARADWHRERGDAYAGQAADARSHARDLTRQQGLGRIALWRAGTSRAELQTAIDAAREQAEAAEQAAAVERREQYTAEQEVHRLRPSYANPLTRLTEMDRDWATLQGDAHRADVEHAERTVTRDGERARADDRAAAADRDRARGLREEAGLRTELPADRLALEDTHREGIEERRLARADREREQRAERRLEQQQRQQEYHHRPPTHGGPGGRGFSM